MTLLILTSNQMNFPYHTESVSQHLDHFDKKQKNFEKNVGKENNYFSQGGRYPFAENSAEIINLIFYPFPKPALLFTQSKYDWKWLRYDKNSNITAFLED